MKFFIQSKYITGILAVVLMAAVLLNTGFCFAADRSGGSGAKAVSGLKRSSHSKIHEKEGLYTGINSTVLKFSVSRGKAHGTVMVTAKKPKDISSAKVTLKFVNKKTGTIKTFDGKMKKAGKKYVFDKKINLKKRGKYYVKARIKCYKNGKCVETIDKTSGVKKY